VKFKNMEEGDVLGENTMERANIMKEG
jgi:hypothetical protein